LAKILKFVITMEKKCINISYTEYDSIDELGTSDKLLLEHAIAAADTSYAPYSSFNVGAAVQLSNGEIVSGSNQENAAYPSGTCAERCAIFYANANYPDNAVSAIAIVAMDSDGSVTHSPVTPCGACRQVLLETENRYATPIRILLCGAKEVYVIESARSLLPLQFDAQNIGV
jgi:cytidine deaminase